MDSDIWLEYFDWLCQRVTSLQTPNPANYRKILWQMHCTEFVPRFYYDDNRVSDSMVFRKQFVSTDILHQVGVFEMMVCLSDRIESRTMGGTVDWDRTAYWFWEMVKSLGLLGMDDNHYNGAVATETLNRFLYRRYSSNGIGGLFTIAHSDVDMREHDIWRQAAAHLNEVLRDEGMLE